MANALPPLPGNRAPRCAPCAWLWGALLSAMCAALPAQTPEPTFEEVISALVAVHAVVPSTARTASSLGTDREGTGVVIDSRGLVLTIGYLILEADSAKVTFAGGQTLEAEILAYDHNTGLGLLKVALPAGVRPMELGNSAELNQMDQVLISSFGGIDAVQPAVVVSRRVFAGYWEYLLEEAIFTAPPHPEFGGAALIGPEGELLGIGSLMVSDAHPGRMVPGNMFVPIDELAPIMGDLLTLGRSSAPPRPWLGIYSEEMHGHLVVTRVAADGPGSEGGIKPGDIIVGIDENPVESLADFYRRLWAKGPAGVEVSVRVLRESEIVDVRLRSANRYEWLSLKPRG